MGSVYRTEADKLKLLRLAKEYRNVARACDEMDFSRDSYYRIRALYKRLGEAGLKSMSRRRRLQKFRGAPEVEPAVLELSRAHPGWGQVRVAKELRRKGVRVSPTGVRGVWKRHNPPLTTRRLRGFVPTVRPPKHRLDTRPGAERRAASLLAYWEEHRERKALYREALTFFGYKLRREPLYREIRDRYEELATKFRSDPKRMSRLDVAYQTLLRGPREYYSSSD